jgi:SCF-associated factor 1
MWTWGQGNHGELGLGGNKDRSAGPGEPEKVVFGKGKENFVFGITAGGWHTGALVLGSTKRDDDDQEEEEEDIEEAGNQGGMPGGFPQQGNHPALGGPMFRIGFAGRGIRGTLPVRRGPMAQPFDPGNAR